VILIPEMDLDMKIRILGLKKQNSIMAFNEIRKKCPYFTLSDGIPFLEHLSVDNRCSFCSLPWNQDKNIECPACGHLSIRW
jgi:hypothetical protein